MCEYAVPADGATVVQGVIKSTVHDFHVREVARDPSNPLGAPVQLTELAPEVEDTVGADAMRRDWRAFEWDDFEDPEERDAALDGMAALLAPGGGDAIKAYLRGPAAERERRGVRAVMVCDKEGRRRLHQFAKDSLPCIDTSTEVMEASAARDAGFSFPDAALDPKTGQVRVLTARPRRTSLSRSRRWPKDAPSYTHFVLHKQGEDSASAVALLARVTGRHPKVFSLAGAKDRWAVTVQRASAHHVWPDELARANRESATVRVGDCSRGEEEVGMGQLWGNEFSIVVRELQAGAAGASSSLSSSAAAGGVGAVDATPEGASEAAVAAAHGAASAMRAWEAASFRFVNYFGAQRFGTFAVRTHETGVAILKGRFAEAICLCLNLRPEDAQAVLDEAGLSLDNVEDSLAGAAAPPAAAAGDEDDDEAAEAAAAASSSTSAADKAARRATSWAALPEEERRARLVLSVLRRRIAHAMLEGDASKVMGRRTASHEFRVLSALAERHPRDTLTPLVAVPRGVRLMFVHAVQSWLFNHAATERVRTLGREPVAGDLVLDREALERAGVRLEDVESGAGTTIMRGGDEDDAAAADDDDDNDDDDEGKEDGRKDDDGSSTPASDRKARDRAAKALAQARLPPVRVLTAADVASGAYSIDDVVLPLPGTRVTYPGHACGAALTVALLARLGLEDPCAAAIATAAGDPVKLAAADDGPCLWGGPAAPLAHCSLGDMVGAYRSLMARAGAPSWRVSWYDGAPGARLPRAIETDVDRLTPAGAPAPAEATAAPAAMAEPRPCLVLRLRLRQGVYATMAMREALHGDPDVCQSPLGVLPRFDTKRPRKDDGADMYAKRSRPANE